MNSSDLSRDLPADPAVLGEEIARAAAHLDAATHRLLTYIRAFDASEEWGRQGALSCAHWLAWRVGLDAGTAREKVRVARALGGLPLVDDGLRRGQLSYAKARALTRVATPANEALLVDMARWCTGAQLERFCRRLRRVASVTADGERLDERRCLTSETLDCGLVRISAVLHPDEAATVMKAVDEARRRRTTSDVSTETAHAVPSRADALVQVASTYLATEATTTTATMASGAQLVVHLEPDLLSAEGGLAATLDDGTRVSAEAFRRLSCDGTAIPLRSEANGARVPGQSARIVGQRLRRALWLRDRGCRFPGCSNGLFIHAHHIRHWVHGGATTMENLTLLCSTHHRLIHEGGFVLERSSEGELLFKDPRGRPIDRAPGPPALAEPGLEALAALHARAGLRIDAETGMPGWDGDAIDYEWALDQVIRQSEMATDRTGSPIPAS